MRAIYDYEIKVVPRSLPPSEGRHDLFSDRHSEEAFDAGGARTEAGEACDEGVAQSWNKDLGKRL